MQILHYLIEIQNVIDELNKKEYKKILIQLPEGLKHHSLAIKKEINTKNHFEIFFSGDPCYGACDIPCINQLNTLGIQAVIQIGHTNIPSLNKRYKEMNMPIYFVNALSSIDVKPIIRSACDFFEGKKIGIVTTAQHIHKLHDAIEILSSQGFSPIILSGDERIAEKGQILGCNFSAAKSSIHSIDSYLFIGSGMFHSLGLLLSTEKPVIIADPYENKIKKEELIALKERILRQRFAAITIAKSAKKYGILICSKMGQQRIRLAERIKKTLDALDKESISLVFDSIDPVALQNYPEIDCYISTACPRIAIDDYTRYKKPIITPVELEIALEKKSFNAYCFDEII